MIKWQKIFLVYFTLIALVIVGAYTGFIPTEIGYIPYYDTIGHFVLLGLLSYILHRTLNRRHVILFSVKLPVAPLVVTLLAIIEESAQTLSPIRAFSYFDLLSNLIGIWLFYFIDLINVRRKLTERVK